MIKTNRNMRGVFAVELVIGLLILSGALVIVLNHLLAFNKKGALDRAAYSIATIMSERKQLFNSNMSLCVDNCNVEAEIVFNLVVSSLRRMDASFDNTKLGMRIDYVSMAVDEVSGNLSLGNNKPLIFGNTIQCNFRSANDVDINSVVKLLPQVSSEASELLGGNVFLPFYQVSLCYEIPLDLIGATTGEVFRLISTSYSFARI